MAIASVKKRPHAAAGAKEPQPTAAQQYFSRAVAKALDLLEMIGKSGEPLSLNQLAAKIRLTKTSAFRLLYTLEATGYVERDGEGRYALKHRARDSVREKLIAALLEAAAPHMRELTREFRETTGLAALFENHIEVIAVVESPQIVRMGNTVGRIVQPHASSLGKCITAFQPEPRREQLLRSYGLAPATQHTITDETELHAELMRVRERGYATDREETCIEGSCFGAPIRNPEDEVFAAVSLSMPKSRLGGADAQERIIRRVREAAASISSDLRK